MATAHTNRLTAGAIQPVSKQETASQANAIKRIEPNDLSEVMTFAQVAVRSSMFGLRTIEEAAARILYGRELGLSAFQSIIGIEMIQGKVGLKAVTVASQIQNSGRFDYRVLENTSTKCRIAFFDRGEQLGISEFTTDMAKRAGLMKEGSNWFKWPDAMLFARAITQGSRRYCPSVFFGPVYSSEELADGGDVIDVQISEPVVVEPEPVVETKPAKAATKLAKVEPVAEVKPPANDAPFDEVEQAQAETTADKTRKLDEWADRVAKRFDEKGQASFASAGTVVEEMYRRFLDLGFVVPGATTYRARTGAIAAIDAPWAEILDNLKGFAAELAAELDAPPAEDTREPGAEG